MPKTKNKIDISRCSTLFVYQINAISTGLRKAAYSKCI